MAHNQYYDTFHGVISARIIQDCALLDEKEKAFAKSYSWLRMISEGQKASVPLTPAERTLANAWRHPGEKSRADITSEVDSNYLQKIFQDHCP